MEESELSIGESKFSVRKKQMFRKLFTAKACPCITPSFKHLIRNINIILNLKLLKGTYQCYYMSLFVISIGHISHINPTHFSQIALSMRYVFFHICPYTINVTEKT